MKKIFNTTVSVKEGAGRQVLRGIIQYDTLNEVHVRLSDGNRAFDYSGYDNIIFKVLKADGTTYIDSEGERVIASSPADGIITLILTGQATTAAGLCQSVIEVYAAGEKLTTARLNYEVFGALEVDEDAILSEPEYPVLQNLITDVSTLEAAIEAAETSRAEAESTRASAESDRADAEAQRISNENVRIENENDRIAAETAREDKETGYVAQAKAAAETAVKNAEAASTSETNAKASETNAKASETAAKASETAAKAAQTAAEKSAREAAACVEQYGVDIPAGRMRGDIDGDGRIDETDKTALSRFDAGWDDSAWVGDEETADVNGDGEINGKDIMILGYIISDAADSAAYTPGTAGPEVTGNWINNPNAATETGQFYTDINIPGLVSKDAATITVDDSSYDQGKIDHVECMDGKLRVYVTLCPVAAVPCTVRIIRYNGAATFTPSVSENGDLSWTNDKGMPNPETVNIKGKKGDTGATGPQGETGYTPQRGVDYWTAADQQTIVDDVLAALPSGDEVSY